MSCDDTSTHRHNSLDGYLLPINNNYQDGYMQPLLFEGASVGTPNGIGGVQEANFQQTSPYTVSAG
jgi:catalase